MTQNTAPEYDPLQAALKKPAVSFKNDAVGAVRTLQVLSYSDSAQTTDFATKQPAFWPLKAGQAEPDKKMAAVYDVFDELEQEERTLWAPIPSSLLTALANAQKEAGQRIGPGGTLRIKLTGTKPSGKGNDQKIYAAQYVPGETKPAADPLADAAPVASDPWGTSTPASDDQPPF